MSVVCLVLASEQDLPDYESWLPNAFETETQVKFRFCCDPSYAPAAAAGAHVLICSPPFFSRELFQAAVKLRWIHSNAHGVKQILIPEVIQSPVHVTSAKGVFTLPVAEHAIAMILALARRLPCFLTPARPPFPSRNEPMEVAGKTLGLIGLGTIGSAIAQRGRCLEMRVVAVRKHPDRTTPFVDEIWGPGDLDRLVCTADFLVLAAPHTAETETIIGAPELARMKPSSFVVNVSRGALVDEGALASALHNGEIAGAALDVTTTDPHSEDSPLCGAPNLLLTPYVAYSSPEAIRRGMGLVIDNLGHFLAGRPLRNLVDKENGY